MSRHVRPFIRTAHGPDGALTYLIETPPQALPPVRSGDLAEAWRTAREAAVESAWGIPRMFRFLGDDGPVDLALTDDDACCWAEALDRQIGLTTAYGLAMCIRLLALIDLIGRAAWAKPLCRLSRAGAALDPALLRAAATAPLNGQAGFDDAAVRARVGHAALAPPTMIPGVMC